MAPMAKFGGTRILPQIVVTAVVGAVVVLGCWGVSALPHWAAVTVVVGLVVIVGAIGATEAGRIKRRTAMIADMDRLDIQPGLCQVNIDSLGPDRSTVLVVLSTSLGM